MTIEDRYRLIIEAERDGESAFDQVESDLEAIEKVVEDTSSAFDELEDSGSSALSELSDKARREGAATESALDRMADSADNAGSAFGGLPVSFGDVIDVVDGLVQVVDFAAEQFGALSDSVDVAEGSVGLLNRGFSALDTAKIEQANNAFNVLAGNTGFVAQGIDGITQSLAVGLGPTLGVIAEAFGLTQESASDLSEEVDSFARRAVLGLAKVYDGVKLITSGDAFDLVGNIIKNKINDAAAAVANFTGSEQAIANTNRERIRLANEAIAVDERSVKLVDSLEAGYAALDEQLRQSTATLEETRGKVTANNEALSELATLGGSGGAATTSLSTIKDQAQELGQAFNELRDIGGTSGLLGSVDFDDTQNIETLRHRLESLNTTFTNAQNVTQYRTELDDLLSTFTTDFNLDDADDAAAVVEHFGNVLERELQRIERYNDGIATVAEVIGNTFEGGRGGVRLEDLDAQADAAQRGIDITSPIDKSLEDEAASLAENYDLLGQSLGNLGQAFGALGQIASSEGEKSFKQFQRIQIAMASAAAISASIQAASNAGGNPFAILAAYTSIGATLFGAVAQLKALNTSGSTPTRLPGGSAPSLSSGGNVPDGPRGGTADDLQQQPAGDTVIVLNGRRRYDSDDLEELVRELNRRDLGRQIRTRVD